MARHHMTVNGPVPYTAEEEAARDAEEAANAARIVVPAAVPRRKAVKYMRRTEHAPGLSLYDHLIATINAIPDLQIRSDAMDDFMESLYFERDSPQMIGLAALAGISREQLDSHLTGADKLP
jgi:hypothetical protein